MGSKIIKKIVKKIHALTKKTSQQKQKKHVYKGHKRITKDMSHSFQF